MEINALLETIEDFTRRCQNSLYILDRIVPNVLEFKTMEEKKIMLGELEIIRDEINQVAQVGILIRDNNS